MNASPETYQPPLRVLVADDEPPIRLLCQVNLAVAGIDVLQAADGEEALALARSEKPDIVLLDLMMPNVGRVTGRAGPLQLRVTS